jgi:cell division protein FtsB
MKAKIKTQTTKTIEMPLHEFEKLTEELQQCRKDKAELEKANKFLNEQIKEYNDKFAKDTDER